VYYLTNILFVLEKYSLIVHEIIACYLRGCVRKHFPDVEQINSPGYLDILNNVTRSRTDL